MKKVFVFLALIAASLLVYTLILETKSTPNQMDSKNLKGVSVSPINFSESDFLDFFETAKEAGSVIAWAGNSDNFQRENSAPFVLVSLSQKYGYIPLIITDHNNPDNLISFVEKYNIKFVGIGNEINRLERDEFKDYEIAFPKIYDGIKSVSPDTTVFTVFQLENLRGLNGGLFGGENDESKNNWDLIDKFTKSDAVGFTTYPGAIYKDPSDIPDDYYSKIAQHTKKPIIFTEIGWPSDTEAEGWESTESEQARFVNKYFELTANLPVELSIWVFLYDQNVQAPFTSVGLFDRDGSQKQAWQVWKEYSK